MLADSGHAIGAVTKLLHDRLLAPALDVSDVTVGRPEPPNGNGNLSRVNLFLYDVHFDGFLRNHPLDVGQPDPLWLSLHYVLTAFDDDGESDSVSAHELLGDAIRCLYGLNFLHPSSVVVAALGDNPEPLKVTFPESSPDLLSKLMQGPDEKYRCSIPFEIRPVMIAAPLPPRYALLVGVDYEHSTITGEDGVRIPVLPSLGPVLEDVSPSAVDPGDELTVTGTDLGVPDLTATLGTVEIPITAQAVGSMRCSVDGAIAGGAVLSAGAHVLTVGQRLSSGRIRRSNPLVVDLRPVLTSATPQALTRVTPADPASVVYGGIDLSGVLLGTADDDIFVALYRDGGTVAAFDSVSSLAGPPQTAVRVSIARTAAVEPGSYRVILRVNGKQARSSPAVDLRVP